jgi:hypothetical protein
VIGDDRSSQAQQHLIKRGLLRALALLCCLVASAALAQEQTSVSGLLRMDYMSSSRDLDDRVGNAGATAQIKAKHAADNGLRVEFETRVTQSNLLHHRDEIWRLLSGFAEIERDDVSLRIGQQRVRWGKADVINPTDFFTPIDFRVPLPLEEDRYLSIPALRTDWRFDDTQNLSLVIEPAWVRSELPSPPAATAFDVNDKRPSAQRRPQIGLRFSQSGSELDWSLSGFSGYSNLPVSTATGTSATGRPQFLNRYPRLNGLGADLARNFGPWSFRLEAAAAAYQADDGNPSPRPFFTAVAGVDRTLNDININVQILYRRLSGFVPSQSSSPLNQLALDQNAALFNEFNRQTWGMTARIAKQWLNQTLQTEFLYVGYFEPNSGLLRPALTYALSDSQKIIFGAEYYFGPDKSFFGPFKANTTIFAELQKYL